MSGTIRLGRLIEKAHIKCRDFKGGQEFEAFGVSNTEGIVRTAHRKSEDLGEYLVIEPGLFAYNPYRVNVGSIGLTPEGVIGVVSPAYVVFRTKERKLVPKVLLDFLKSSEGLRQINKLARGAVRKALRFEDLCEIEFPAISYERQLEILKHKQGFNQQHGQLLLEIEHQQTLLAKLKQAILQEAIQGKLTADWRTAHPNVESAHRLMDRIAQKRTQWIEIAKADGNQEATVIERKLKKLAKCPTPIPATELPQTWRWATLIESNLLVVDCHNKTAPYANRGIPLIRTTNVRNGRLLLASTKFVTEQTYKRWSARCVPEPGDLIFTREAPLGEVGLIPENVRLCLGQRTMLIRPIPDLVLPEFLLIAIQSPGFVERAARSKKGAMVGHLRVGGVESAFIPLPPLAEQKAIVEKVEALMTTCRSLEAEIEHLRTHAAHLLQAVLREAFSCRTVAQVAQDKPAPAETIVIPFPVRIGNISATDLHAGILARAYQHHEQSPKHLVHFGHVKAEKIAHLVEAHLGIDLERVPVKAAAGPNDYPHLKKVESRAQKANWFVVRQQKADSVYVFHKQHGFEALLGKTAAALGERATEVDALINLLLPLNTRQAEIVATLYAAWNNLLLLGRSPSDEDIVYEARENWHPSKLQIEREKFFDSLGWMRRHKLVPVGRGRYVYGENEPKTTQHQIGDGLLLTLDVSPQALN